MSSTTGPSNKSGDGRRRSTRKRQTPHRYGFHDVVDNNNNNNNSSHNDETGSRATKRRKLYAFNNNNNNMESLLLTMIPHDLLLHHILSFCSSVQDRKALQSTNRLFRRATNSPLMIRATQIIIPPTMTLTRHPTHPRRWISKATVRKCFPIVGPAVGREKYDTNNDDNSSDDEEIHVPFDRYWNDYFHHWETSLTVTRTLLPFLRQGNRDALLLLALLAVYVEDDLETGLTLLHYSATTNQQHQHHHHPLKIGGDVRAKHELGMLLSRHPKTHEKDIGRLYLQQAAQEGHAMSQLITVDRKDITMTLKRRAQAELMLLYSTGLKHLLRRKADPPHPRWGSYKCYNPYCHRQHYRATPRCRSWLHTKPFSNEWQPVREQVLECVATLVSTATHSTSGSSSGGSNATTTSTTNTATTTLTSIPSPYFDAQDFYYVPRMPTCGGCRTAIYCDAACQRLHWRLHKPFCRAHAPPNHNHINNDDNDNDNNHNNNNNDDNEVEVI